MVFSLNVMQVNCCASARQVLFCVIQYVHVLYSFNKTRALMLNNQKLAYFLVQLLFE